jgi:hypothetical protein
LIDQGEVRQKVAALFKVGRTTPYRALTAGDTLGFADALVFFAGTLVVQLIELALE